jgi:Holliday junction resolvasome RuvABC endonuclease subunit
MNNFLALDPATKCGWAHSSGAFGTWDLSAKRDESKGMRLVRLRAQLNEVLRLGVDYVFFEAARHAAGTNALVVQSELQGIIKIWCEDNRALGLIKEYRGIGPSEIKKFATGKGNANKEAMIAAAKKRFPHCDIQDDNQADALMLLELAKTLI